MKMSYRMLLTAIASAAAASALAGMSNGCASSDCTDTATCEAADNGDATEGSDAVAEGAVGVANDVVVDRTPDNSVGDVVFDTSVDQSVVEDTTSENVPSETTTPEGGMQPDQQVEQDADAGLLTDADAAVLTDADATVLTDADAAVLTEADVTVVGDGDAALDGGDADATVDSPSDVRADVHDADASDVGPDTDSGPDVQDSASPACGADGGNECVPPPPGGWSNPVFFWSGTNGAAPPCGNLTIDAYQGIDASADLCSCTCEPVGQTCSASAQVYQDKACFNVCAQPAQVDGGCNPLQGNACGSQGSFLPSMPVAAGGSCLAQYDQIDAGAATWTTQARLCSLPTSGTPVGCTNSSICLPTPSSQQYRLMCVYQDGIASACPTGFTSQGPTVYFRSLSDTRGCSQQCTCRTTPPTGGTCAGSVELFPGTNCTGTPAVVVWDGGTSCPGGFDLVTTSAGSVQGVFNLVEAGTCGQPTLGSQAEGGVTGTSPLTVCCM